MKGKVILTAQRSTIQSYIEALILKFTFWLDTTEKQVGKRFLTCPFLDCARNILRFGFFSNSSESASAQAYRENGSFPNTHRATGSPLPGPNDPFPSPPARPAAPGSGTESRVRPSQCGLDPRRGPDSTLSCLDSRPWSCREPNPAWTSSCDTGSARTSSCEPGPAWTRSCDPGPAPARTQALPDPGPVLPGPRPYPTQTLALPKPSFCPDPT